VRHSQARVAVVRRCLDAARDSGVRQLDLRRRVAYRRVVVGCGGA
jgi:hypothetical protein